MRRTFHPKKSGTGTICYKSDTLTLRQFKTETQILIASTSTSQAPHTHTHTRVKIEEHIRVKPYKETKITYR